MKAGTTSMHRYLDLHPDIHMSGTKELDFFVEEKNWPRGIDWYRSHFVGKFSGESSPNYSKYPAFDGVPERMRAVVPGIKLIYILRDPIERIISHYLHNVSAGTEARAISEVLSSDDGHHYIACSNYWLQLSKFREFFTDQQILLVQLERLQTEPGAVMNSVFSFLGVEALDSEEFSTRHHESAKKARPNWLGRQVSGSAALDIGRKLVPRQLKPLAARLLRRPVVRPELPENICRELCRIFRDDLGALQSHTGWDLHAWPSWVRSR